MFSLRNSLEKWSRALLRVACPGPVDSCDYEVDEPLLHVSLELIRHGLEYKYIVWDWTNTFSSLGSPTYEHSASDVSAEDSCFFCSSWTYSCRWSYLMMFWRGSPIQKKLKSNTWKTSYSNFVEFNLSAQKVEIVVICNPYKSVICYLSCLLFVIRS